MNQDDESPRSAAYDVAKKKRVIIMTEGPAIITQQWVYQLPDEITSLPLDPDEALEFLNEHRVPSRTSYVSHRQDNPTGVSIETETTYGGS